MFRGFHVELFILFPFFFFHTQCIGALLYPLAGTFFSLVFYVKILYVLFCLRLLAGKLSMEHYNFTRCFCKCVCVTISVSWGSATVNCGKATCVTCASNNSHG